MSTLKNLWKRRPSLPEAWRAELTDHAIAVRISPDGARLAAASVDGPVDLFDIETGRCLRTLKGHAMGTLAIDWAPDAQHLATCGQDGQARVWDTHDGSTRLELDGGAAWVERVLFRPDGQALATAAGRSLKLWSAHGTLRMSYPEHPSTIADIAWFPRIKSRRPPLLASAAYGKTQLFAEDQAEPAVVMAWKGSSLRLAPSPDGAYLATGDQDATIHIWRPSRVHEPEHAMGSQMSGFAWKVRELSWDASGRYLATGGFSGACVWDCSSPGPEGRRPKMLAAINRETALEAEPKTTDLAFQPSGRLLAVGDDLGGVGVYDPQRSQHPLVSRQLGEPISQLAWTHDDLGLIVGTAEGRVIRLFLAQPNP